MYIKSKPLLTWEYGQHVVPRYCKRCGLSGGVEAKDWLAEDENLMKLLESQHCKQCSVAKSREAARRGRHHSCLSACECRRSPALKPHTLLPAAFVSLLTLNSGGKCSAGQARGKARACFSWCLWFEESWAGRRTGGREAASTSR